MPRFLRIITGDAKAVTNGANAKAQRTCSGFDIGHRQVPDLPARQPVSGSATSPAAGTGPTWTAPRTGRTSSSPTRDRRLPGRHDRHPAAAHHAELPVPRGASYAVDSFPEQLHDPLTDHNDFTNVMPDR